MLSFVSPPLTKRSARLADLGSDLDQAIALMAEISKLTLKELGLREAVQTKCGSLSDSRTCPRAENRNIGLLDNVLQDNCP